MNVEASKDGMDELTTTFRFNDAVVRNLVIRRDEPVVEESFIMKAEKKTVSARAVTRSARLPRPPGKNQPVSPGNQSQDPLS